MPLSPSPRHLFTHRNINRPQLHNEVLALFTSLFFVLFSNTAFWSLLLQGRDFTNTVMMVFGVGILLIGAQWLLLLLLFHRWTSKALLYLLLPLTALADYFTSHYGIYLDKSMMTNLIETDVPEAMDLFEWGILPHLALYALLPVGLVMVVRIRRDTLRRAIIWRLGSLLTAFILLAGGLWISTHELIPLMRANKEMRYLITPGNYLVSGVRALGQHGKVQLTEHTLVGEDAARSSLPPSRRPRLLVLVVGETVRAANWGLSGYTRQTTPLLARHNVVNFAEVTSCGTDTATSVPCMFSLSGRYNYDAERIRTSESVLHVLDRAGVSIVWRDNQSGCKGACGKLPYEKISRAGHQALCAGEHCHDDILHEGLNTYFAGNGDKLIVLHMLGNHGPAYYQRYPDAFRHWTPTCDTTRLATCSQQALQNTYDNAILYTDHFLAQTIDLLDQITDHDSGMIYVSDHGESLGENGLYLHGFPYSIAPKAQTRVPMVVWMSAGLSTDIGIDRECLHTLASTTSVSHDHLSHTLLGLFDVATSAYLAKWDLLQPCRGNNAAQHPATNHLLRKP